MNAQVIEVLKNSAAVPSVPQVVTRVMQIMQDPQFDYGDVVKAISADAGAVSEVLRLANSALFGVRQKVVVLRQALTLLGPKRTRSLLLGRYLVDSMNAKSIEGIDMIYFWRRSLTAAVLASHLANVVARKSREEAFISALLAKIGLPVLAQAMPSQYRPIVSGFVPNGRPITIEEELEAVGATHAEVSALILAHWKLPELITLAVNLHLSDNPGEGEAATVARIIKASNDVARLLCEVPDVDEVSTVCQRAADAVGVDLSVLGSLLSTVEKDIEELADILRVDIIQSNAYTLIVKTVQDQLDPETVGA
jgi:two-component system cell cycle response regulator